MPQEDPATSFEDNIYRHPIRPIFYAIAAMSENRVIGNQGKIPWHLPEDFRWFKHKTMGGTLIMGRKTFESIGKPLPGRKTMVLSRQPLKIPDVEVYADASWLMKKITNQMKAQAFEGDIAWICGGAEIYQQFLPECQALYLTRVKGEVAGDAFFPVFEDQFSLQQIIHENAGFRVERWDRKNPDADIPPPEFWPFSIQSK